MDKNSTSVINYDESYYANLPPKGWIKLCYIEKCRKITSSYIIVKYNSKHIDKKYYMCPECIKNQKYTKLKIYTKYHKKSEFTIYSNRYDYLA